MKHQQARQWLAAVMSVTGLSALGCTIQSAPPPQQPQPAPVAEAPAPPAEAEPPPAAPEPAPAYDEPPVYEGELEPIPGMFRNFKSREAIVCQGNESLAIRDAIIDTRNVAIVARDNCQISVKKSFIRGRGIAVIVQGNATVSLNDSRVVGRSGIAIRTTENGSVLARNSEIVGRTEGAFSDRGGNRFSSPAPFRPAPPPPPSRPAPPPPPAPVPPPPPAEDDLPPIPGLYKNFKTRAPVVCGGNENIGIRDAIIETRDVAIIARDNCQVSVKKSFVRGRRIGIIAEGNARVSIVDSRIVGWSGTSVQVHGNATVMGRNSEFVGRTEGRFADRGGNQFTMPQPYGRPPRHGAPPPPPPPPAEEPLPPIPGLYKNFKTRDPVVCRGNESVGIRDAIIDTRDVAIIARDNCQVSIKKSFVRGRRFGIIVEGNATVSIVDSRIVGWSGTSVQVRDNGTAMGRKSEFVGRPQGNFVDKGGNQIMMPRPYRR